MKNSYPTSTRRLLCSAALLLAIGAPATFAQSSSTGSSTSSTGAVTRDRTTATTTTLSRGDKRFVNKSAELGLEEVQLSKLAAERATNPQVREFAQMLVAAHEKANAELTTLASSKGVALEIDRDKVNLNKWSDKKADDFDEDYLDRMIDAHEDAIELLQDNAEKGEDSELAAYSRKHLPHMQEHLRKAKDLRKMVD